MMDLGRDMPRRLTVRPMDLVLAAGRMSRDGLSLAQIRTELDIPAKLVSDPELERFLDVARFEFAKAVLEGREPAASQVPTLVMDGIAATLPDDEPDD